MVDEKALDKWVDFWNDVTTPVPRPAFYLSIGGSLLIVSCVYQPILQGVTHVTPYSSKLVYISNLPNHTYGYNHRKPNGTPTMWQTQW